AAKRFVCSTEEMRLCSVLLAWSTFLFAPQRLFQLPAHRFASTSACPATPCFCPVLQREPNYSKRCRTLASAFVEQLHALSLI
ncbi:MAG: hypothetical protein Q8Q81_04430, partial [Oxalobacteraceae bacterium]|nr:hypothetical protein [Oxalobacteraceae bacterium]